MKYYGQYLQDQFLNENIFQRKRNGFFLEMGADDGVKHSNTLFFEKELGWNGICIEPRETAFTELIKNRKCICENVCIADRNEKRDFMDITGYADQLSGLVDSFDNEHLERIKKEVDENNSTQNIVKINCVTLNDIFSKHGISKIDYLSLDIEGDEIKILESIDFSKISIDVFSIENNYRKKDIKRFLLTNGYYQAKKIGIDEIYIRKNAELPKYKHPFNLKSFLQENKNAAIRKMPRRVKDFIKKLFMTKNK